MRKTLVILVTVIMVTALMLSLTCCDTLFNNNKVIAFAEELKAKPVASSNSVNNLNVLDSKSDGNYNYYLIYVGYIKDMYISTLAAVDYTGVPVTLSKTETKTSSYISTLTKSVTDSITVTDTQSHKVGISLDVNIKKVLKITPSYEWKGTWTNSNVSTMSTTDTISSANDYAESLKIEYSFGKNTDEIGKYRAAVYGTCDIYFVVKTSVDNNELLLLDTQVCAREDSYCYRFEFSANREFNNESIDKINIADDFYKNLPLPSKTNDSSVTYSTVVRTGTTKIYNRKNNVIDDIYFNFDYSYAQLKAKGFSKISIYLSVDIKEKENSSDLYNGIQIQDKSGATVKTWEYKRHRGDWKTYEIDLINLDMDRFYLVEQNKFTLSIKYYCKDSNFQDWYLGTVRVRIVAE